VNDVAVERKRYAKAEPGKLVGPASHAARLAHGSGVFRAELPAVREALAGWNVTIRPATPICSPPNSWRTAPDTPAARQGSPAQPPTPAGPARPWQSNPDSGRGRGMAIVTARATASGVRAERGGKTAWFIRRPTASAVCPLPRRAPKRLSLRRYTPLASLMVSAGPARAVTGDAHPRKEHTGNG
jgi:hypothetical protein